MNTNRLETSGANRLYAAAHALTGAMSATDVALAVFQHALADLGASSVGLWLVDAGTIRFVGGTGSVEDIAGKFGSIPLDEDLPGPISVRTREAITYSSVAERDRRWPHLTGVATASQGTAVVPLLLGDRVLGCLHISFAEAMEPDAFDLSFLQRLAQLTAAALDRAQLYDAERGRQQFLLDASAAVADAEGFVGTLRSLAKVAVPRLADMCLIDVLEGAEIRRVAAVHADPSKADVVAELAERYPPDPAGSHPARAAMTSRRSLWAADMPDEFLEATTRDPRHLELIRALGFSSYMCVPLVGGGEVLGAMTLVSAGSGRRFEGSDLALAESLAFRVTDVVVAARRHEREHNLAHVLQRLLLPDRLPATPGVDVAGRYQTAAPEAEAGGDFYDLVTLPSGRLGFVIGDVEGHDAAAAAIMGQLRSAARALSGQFREPSQLVDALRWSWDLLGFARMATAVFGRLDPATGELVLTSAGHPPPVVVGADGHASLLDPMTTPPLGAPSGPAHDRRTVLGPGETLFLYTDGLVEHRLGSIDEGVSALVRSLEVGAGAPLDELCDLVISGHPALAGRGDDVAVLALRRSKGDG